MLGVIFMVKFAHMSLHDRIVIENSLNNGHSFKTIGFTLGKDCTTISKEVRKNSVQRNISAVGRTFNNCVNRYNCQLYNVCDKCNYNNSKLCRSCNLCRNQCDQFVEEVCSKLSKPPYVCNNCSDKQKCTLTKNIYYASEANKRYKSKLVESRQGIIIDENDIRRLNHLLVPLIKEQGQSIHHVYINHKDEIMMSEKTLYKIIDAGLLDVRNIDMPRKVKMKKRKSKPTGYKVDKNFLDGRSYEDFQRFREAHPDMSVVEMDTVEGKKGESCLLTIHFPVSSFMIAIKREFNDSKSVTDYFNNIYDQLGLDTFRKLFPIILTDNGSEFSNPKAIEFNDNNERRTYVFYCHPSAPYEKGSCEVNHELLRRIVPKGISWNKYTQKDINLMMSHINSYARDKLNDKSPLSMFSFIFDEDILSLFNISCIQPDDINLTPSLISSNQ